MVYVDAIICSLNEEKYIEDCLESIMNQSYIKKHPNDIKITLADSNSEDATRGIASKYNVTILDAPRGKLSARDAAIRQSDGKYIIALDADTFYPMDFFERIMDYFNDPEVVAVSGHRLMDNWFARITEEVSSFMCNIGLSKRMIGGVSAFLREAYLAFGGFDLTIDQRDILKMISEEEEGLGYYLSIHGRYIHDPSILAYSSSRRLDQLEYSLERVKMDTF